MPPGSQPLQSTRFRETMLGRFYRVCQGHMLIIFLDYSSESNLSFHFPKFFEAPDLGLFCVFFSKSLLCTLTMNKCLKLKFHARGNTAKIRWKNLWWLCTHHGFGFKALKTDSHTYLCISIPACIATGFMLKSKTTVKNEKQVIDFSSD